ncbi:MAG: class I SAM-dependent methyltransferase [Thermoleophilia bacterium]|nr:class I SAM-dependent methyltransferase [Thermoleophilia bacterium]
MHSCVLVDSREAALAFPQGDIRLELCGSCGFVQNSAFDPGLIDYFQEYEETQGYSATFEAFARGLAAALVARHDLRGKEILEIGCGKGEFLALLCELGGNRGLGSTLPTSLGGRVARPPIGSVSSVISIPARTRIWRATSSAAGTPWSTSSPWRTSWIR